MCTRTLSYSKLYYFIEKIRLRIGRRTIKDKQSHTLVRRGKDRYSVITTAGERAELNSYLCSGDRMF